MQITVNGIEHNVDVEEDMPLLWVLRDELGITGPKYGCGIAQCGACTVHLDASRSVRASLRRAMSMAKSPPLKALAHPERCMRYRPRGWKHQVAQCGYCQSGQIMAAASFLDTNDDPTDEDIDQAMSANLCRCGTYPRIREAVKTAAKTLRSA